MKDCTYDLEQLGETDQVDDGPEPSEEEVTRELRSLGAILNPVSADEKKQLDMLGALVPARKRRKKKGERNAERNGKK